ncbi:MAG: hypothetical protein KDK70_27865, partial [Myxococcales bacterium]|nr:hypothetical protein [Myxococcales bacterium]
MVVGITLASGCCDEPQEPMEEPEELEEPPDYNEGRCFEPLRELTIDWSLATARWIHADVNDDGRGDLVAIALDSGPGWALHPLLGTADGEPFVQQPPVIVDVDFPLAEGRIVFADANGDDVADLATYHDGRIVIVEGPLQGAPQVVETPIEGLHWARGEFIDFDEDGVLDFVMREGTGDNLVSYRGLAEGGFELAGTAEFHQDTFCIDQILAEDRLDDWFVALGSDCGGVFASRLRVALFSVGDDGSMVELAAQEFDRDLFDRDLSLRMAGNLL